MRVHHTSGGLLVLEEHGVKLLIPLIGDFYGSVLHLFITRKELLQHLLAIIIPPRLSQFHRKPPHDFVKVAHSKLISVVINTKLFTSMNHHTKSVLLSEPGNPLKSHSHCSALLQDVKIIMKGQGVDGVRVAEEFVTILKDSLMLLSDTNCTLPQINAKVQNLLESGREQLNQLGLEGTVSMLICLRVGQRQIIIKNKDMECYFFNQNREILPIGSRQFPFQSKRQPRPQKQTMQERNGLSRQFKGLAFLPLLVNTACRSRTYFENPVIEECIFSNQGFFLLGNTQCFAYLEPKEIIKYFTEEKQLCLRKVAAKMLEDARKKWKTIYQSDMSLIIYNKD